MRTRTVILPKLSSKLMVCLSSKIRTSYIWTQDSCNWNLPTLRRGIFCFYGHFLLHNLSSGRAACSIKTQKAFFFFFFIFCCCDVHLLIFMNKHWFIWYGSYTDRIQMIGKLVTQQLFRSFQQICKNIKYDQ